MRSRFANLSIPPLLPVVLASILGCSSNPPKPLPATLQAEPYHNAVHSFTIHFPKNFESIPIEDNGTIVHFRDPADHANINLRSGDTGGESLRSLFAEVKQSVPTQVQNAKIHGDGETTIDSVPARWIDISHTVDGTTVRAITYLVVKKRKFFLIFCTASENTFEGRREVFRDSAESLQIQ